MHSKKDPVVAACETLAEQSESLYVDGYESSQDENADESAEDFHNTTEPYQQSFNGLLPLLEQLDQRLAAAVQAADQMFAARSRGDLYRGLAISPADVAAALARPPGEPFLSFGMMINQAAAIGESLSVRRMAWLQQVFGLSEFELGIILVALAPEIDLRYERLYAYLHDDVSRRRPSVDLALNILCASGAEKLHQRDRFAPDAPLLRHRLIEFTPESGHHGAPLLSRHYRLDEQITRLLLLDDSLDSRLAVFCKMRSGVLDHNAPPLAEEIRQRIQSLAINHARNNIRLYLHGPAECGQLEASTLLTEQLDMRVLLADLGQFPTQIAVNEALHTLAREAWFRGALLHLRGMEQEPPIQLDALWNAIKEMPVDVVIEGQDAWLPSASKPTGVIIIPVSYPNTAQRKQWWTTCLQKSDVLLGEENLTPLAQRYRMTYAQIQNAAAVAGASVLAGECESKAVEDEVAKSVFAAARAQCGHDLTRLASKVDARATWDDLVLPEDATEQLHELCNRYIYRDKVLYEWGFAKKLSYGLGINALFAGGPGTGKTMAAEVIANALGLDLYKIDLAQVVSKYIGETEKNLDKLFTAATNANAILFFDEADALFGKRSEVKDSHDRYANLEISYLLQKMEQYEGIAILATNLSDNLDDAFTRRLAFSIHFPFPAELSRKKLWDQLWPPMAHVSEDMDFSFFAKELRLSGGNIKNIGIGAAFLAAEKNEAVSMKNLVHAAEREYRKLAKPMIACLVSKSENQ